ncbi:MAG: redoxin domain-containing protein [Bacteroidetes bacterium]|nr:redoxin domain-containing protein [Bacteroidota bacterium]
MLKERLTQLLSISLLISLLAGCHSLPEGTATIRGSLKDAARLKLYLYQLLPESSPLIDSAETDRDGNFSFHIFPDQKSIYLLQSDSRNSITLVLDKNDHVTIEAEGRQLPSTYSISGSDESKIFWEFNKHSLQGQQRLDSLSKILNESHSMKDFPSIRRKLDSTYQQVFETSRKDVLSFLEAHTHSLAAVILVNYTLGGTPLVTANNDTKLFRTIDTALSAKYNANPNYQAFHTRLHKFSDANQISLNPVGGASEGNTITEILLNDRNGKSRPLSGKEKYTLVYFWVSWKPESRDLTTNLVGLYESFHSKGFGIYSISLDEDKTAWLSALQRDRVNWPQVNDPAGLKSEYAKLFRVQKLPELFLLNEKKQVISSDISVPGLKAFLLEKL